MKPAITIRGKGPRLDAHPGGPGLSGAEFLPDFGGRERAFEVAYIDPRGTGGSPAAETYALADYVADLEELRVELGVDTIDLLGFSHGGLVAAAYAAERPSRVRRLVLAGALAAFTAEMEAEVKRVVECRSGEPWYGAATAALAREE